jgi:hypothetical protein
MIAESGNRRIIEVDRTGEIVKEIPLTVDHPDAHRDTRLARKLENGHYLVCHEGDGTVREYDDAGKVVWSYALDLGGRPRAPGHGTEGHGNEVFGAIRLPTGNTLIATGNGNRVIEVNPDGKILDLTDPELFDYPFIYMIEPGSIWFSDEERTALRKYLENGGFLMVDDFWGDASS